MVEHILYMLFGSLGSPAHSKSAHMASCIYSVLHEKFRACIPEGADYSALGPSPEINTTLTLLVDILCQDFAIYKAVELNREQLPEDFHGRVVQRILDRIDRDGELLLRANRIKRIAGLAEAEMEKFYCKEITTNLDTLSTRAFNDKLASLESRVPDSFHVGPLKVEGRIKAALMRARVAFEIFPYTDNYELMVASELAVVQKHIMRKHSPEEISLVNMSRKVSHDLSARQESDERYTSNHEIAFAFCGSGPLPLSGIFLHILTGSPVVLVDCDSYAAQYSRHLIESLERHGVISVSMLRVVQADAVDVPFRRPGKAQDFSRRPQVGPNSGVECDILFLASLLPTSTKLEIARNTGAINDGSNLMLVRSAKGLTAKFAYDSIPTAKVCKNNWRFMGQLVPARELNSVCADDTGNAEIPTSRESQKVITTMDSRILNTVEVFCRKLGTSS